MPAQTIRRFAPPLFAVWALFVLWPALASGATLSSTGGAITYTAGNGVDNRLAISHTALGTFDFADKAEGITPGVGCSGGGAPGVAATCPFLGVTALNADTGNGSDRIDASGVVATPAVAIALSGGPGEDFILGSQGNDTLNGGSEDDTLLGDDGNDSLNGDSGFGDLRGGGGTDTLNCGDDGCQMDGGAGPDTLNGGDEIDVADYTDRTEDLNVSLDNVANDGSASGEGDNVTASVEVVLGGSGDDMLSGNNLSNALVGGDGADTITTLGGGDELIGNGGADTLTGGDGSDQFSGGPGNDQIDGGEGRDDISGDEGNDVMHGGGGADFFEEGSISEGDIIGPDPSNGSDLLDGGPGRDEADYERTGRLRISLDGYANDGAAGEHDNVQVDDVVGGFGSDVLIGNNLNNRLDGGFDGKDKIIGRGGNDRLVSGGRSRLNGGTGKDRLYARNGRRDHVVCGSGRDHAFVERKDRVSSSCEVVRAQAAVDEP